MTQQSNRLTKRERRIQRAQRHKEQQTANFLNNNIKDIQPKNENQARVFDSFEKGKALLMCGAAGTGKSFCAIYLALKDVLTNPACKQKTVIIIRSIVPTRDVGFLPGNAKEKSRQYESPYYYICNELFGRADAYDILKQKGVIQFETTSFARGMTFDNAIVILDEFQNTVDHELNTIITRMGKNSRLILCGDNKQDDLKKESTGFYKFYKIAERMKSFSIIHFELDDIVRSAFVKEYLIQRHLYEVDQEKADFMHNELR
jgi:phosphate starvation-inducible protein PhoH